MNIALIFVILIAGCVTCIVVLRKKKSHPSELPTQKEEIKTSSSVESGSSNCESTECGVSCFCEDETLKRNIQTQIEYFDDEELDVYKGIASNEYTELQIEEFNEVLTTLPPAEVGDWLHSLELRGIELPDDLKDEAYLLISGR